MEETDSPTRPQSPVYGTTALSSVLMREMHRNMVRIRYFEEKVGDLVEEKKIVTPCHLYIGQEAVAAGACAALRKSDFIWGTHRSHGHYLAKGGDMKAAMAEIFCRRTGCSGGRGGSMHLTAPEVGLFGTSAIVAGSVPLGVGAALAESIRGGDKVSVIFHGDAAPEEGCYHEAANFASLHKLPVVFVCEHNLYCTHLHMNARRPKDNLSEIFATYRMPVHIIDGNNATDVYRTVSVAVASARSGEGPSFIECKTYRWRGHVGPNWDMDLGLRSRAEIDSWVARCPIKNTESAMLADGVLTKEQIETVHQQAEVEVEQASDFAQESPYPDAGEIHKFVFTQKEGL